MLSFARQMGASAYVVTQDKLTVLTQATPLSAAKEFAKGLIARQGNTPKNRPRNSTVPEILCR